MLLEKRGAMATRKRTNTQTLIIMRYLMKLKRIGIFQEWWRMLEFYLELAMPLVNIVNGRNGVKERSLKRSGKLC